MPSKAALFPALFASLFGGVPTGKYAAWLVGLLLLGFGPVAVAENLVVNGLFGTGTVDGWSGGGEVIGYVNEPKDGTGRTGTWVGLSGEIYQDVPTVPGQAYVLNFEAQVKDPRQVWSPNSLQVFWGDTLVSRFDFANSETRWFKPRLLVHATAGLTRLRFVGSGFPSLDEVQLSHPETDFFLGDLTAPAEGAQFTEGDTVILRSEWVAVGGGVAPTSMTYLLNGETALGFGVGPGLAFAWTNVPPGTYYICGENGTQRTFPVRIEIKTRPKLRLEAPLSQAVFDPGVTVHLLARLLDNQGGSAATQVRFLANDTPIQSLAVAGDTVVADWLPPGEGNYLLVAVGLQANGTEVLRDQLTIHVLRPGILDQDLSEEGGSVTFQPATPIAQTFTASVSGRLRAVELYGGHNNGAQTAPVTVAIQEVVDGRPGTNRLGETTLSFAEAYVSPTTSDAARYVFASNRVMVIAGRQYAIVCETRVPASEATYFRSHSPDTYLGGKLWQKIGGVWKSGDTVPGLLNAGDLTFRSYVIPLAPPSVALTSPAPLAEFPADAPITLAASTVAGDGTVARVIFLADGQPLATVEQPPFQFTWAHPGSGNHVLEALVEDDSGIPGASESVSILVGPDTAGQPRLRVEDTASPEGNSSIPPLAFRLWLSAPSPVPVTVDYATRDLTAVAPVDYLAAAGTVTFAPGQTQAFVFVRMLGDLHDEPNKRLRLELVNARGAVLERPSAVGTIVDDEPGVNKVTHFTWELATNRVAALEPFMATLVARDSQENEVQDVAGSIRLTLGQVGHETFTVLGDQTATRTNLAFPNTEGYAFRPAEDLLVTHLRCRGGIKVSLWNEDQRLLASADFLHDAAIWQERELASPVRLLAGQRYRIASFSGEYPYLSRDDADSHFAHGQIEWAYFIGGDGFPTETSPAHFRLVDFRYQLPVPAEGRVEPAEISGFTGGRWTGQLVLTGVGTELQLTATDILGHLGLSPALESGPTDTVRIRSVGGPQHPALELFAPPGRAVFVQASDDLHNWEAVSEALRPEGMPLRWQIPSASGEWKFFRLFLLE